LEEIKTNDLPENLKKIEGIKVSMFTDDVMMWASANNNNKQL
jgi:hypothetical protein